ncbi:unnamed protein product [Dibothriocephalus latus]|uniref:Uncharacterized protein n=1 Tax=Dibothriocephalus latus TaxID=60516 RepID=A0A3P6S5B7_DIBLA|nr:unnamed protein product [Dibothriocephalus latus]
MILFVCASELLPRSIVRDKNANGKQATVIGGRVQSSTTDFSPEVTARKWVCRHQIDKSID